VPVYGVRGNHDVDGLPPGVDDVTGRVVRLADRLWLAGVGWSGRVYADLPGESDLEPACRSVERMALRLVMPGDALVLLTHYPADLPGLFPDVGRRDGVVFDCVHRLIDTLRPMAVVQGHVHEWFGLAARCNWPVGRATLILNPGPGAATLTVDAVGRSATCDVL
jgi:Icc-related predicted phosphoesterase